MKNEMLHEKHEFANVRALIEWAAETYGEASAFSYRTKPAKEDSLVKKSYIELRDDVRALACALSELGCAGKHCALIGKSSYEWALTYYATLSIGAVLVPLDREWLAPDLADTVAKADASFLFCDADIKEKASVICEKVTLDK